MECLGALFVERYPKILDTLENMLNLILKVSPFRAAIVEKNSGQETLWDHITDFINKLYCNKSFISFQDKRFPQISHKQNSQKINNATFFQDQKG